MVLLMKNQIASEIWNIFISMKINQTEFAKLLKIRQAKVSRIFKGHLNEFSLETLINYLKLLGKEVELKII